MPLAKTDSENQLSPLCANLPHSRAARAATSLLEIALDAPWSGAGEHEFGEGRAPAGGSASTRGPAVMNRGRRGRAGWGNPKPNGHLRIAGGCAGLAALAGRSRRAASCWRGVQANKVIGDAAADELAESLREAGLTVEREVPYQTPIGPRVADLRVSDANGVRGLVEVKVGNSPYTAAQQLKDFFIQNIYGHPTNVVRY
jgi:hypothetical protein